MPLPVKGGVSAARISLVRDYVSKIPAAAVLSSSVPPSQPDKHRGLKEGRGAATEGIKSNLQISTFLPVNLVSLGESVPMRESGLRWSLTSICQVLDREGRNLPLMITIGP